MEPRPTPFVTDLDLSAEFADKDVQGPAVRRPHVRRGQDPKRNLPLAEAGQPTAQHIDPRELHERAQEVHPIRAMQLAVKLIGKVRLPPSHW